MGVYIKGVEMPMNCYRCPCADLEYFDCNLMPGTGISSDRKSGKRLDDCPLVPVPKHGRLGDLNALAQQIEHERFHHTHTDSLAARHHVAEYGHFLKAIIDAPTIIPASEEGET